MTNSNFFQSVQANKLLAKVDFDNLYSNSKNNGVCLSDVIVFYARNSKRIFKLSAFWQSKFPLLHVDEVLNSAQGGDFLRFYLRNDTNCNHELNTAILRNCKAKFLLWFKIKGNYESINSSFYKSLTRLSEADNELASFLKKCEEFAKHRYEAQKNKKKILTRFYGHNLDKVITAILVLYSDMKHNKRADSDRAWLVMMEVNLARLLDEIFDLVDQDEINSELNLLSAKFFRKFRVPQLKKPNKRPEWLKDLTQVFQELLQVKSVEFQINHFVSRYTIEYHNELNQNKAYRYDDIKSQLEEQYFTHPFHTFNTLVSAVQGEQSNVPKKLLDLIKRQDFKGIGHYEIEEAKTTIRRKFDFYRVPKEIDYDSRRLNLIQIIQILIDFSRYKGPSMHLMANNEPKKGFIESFGNNSEINIFSKSEFIYSFANYYGLDQEMSSLIIDFLSIKEFKRSKKYDWFQYPFIQINGRIVWVGAFLRDRNWFNILIGRLKGENQKFRAQYAKNIEEKVCALFRTNGFDVLAGRRYKLNDGQNGEVDLIAIKGKSIFIVEVKTVLSKEDPSSVSRIEQEKLNEEAIIQLAKDRVFIDENWSSISEELGVEYSLDEMKVSELVVTDFFEGDQIMLPSKVLKASLLELDVIFNNSMKRLYDNYWANQRIQNAENPEFDSGLKLLEEDLDLWLRDESLTPDLLVEIIRKKKVWSPLYKIWKF